MTPVFNGRRFKTLDLSDDNENFRGYTTMIELYHALKFITMLLFIQKISRFNLAVAFLKSVSIHTVQSCSLYKWEEKSLCYNIPA